MSTFEKENNKKTFFVSTFLDWYNWLKQYEAGGLEGLSRADAETGEVLPEGVERTEENYKREILKLRIENERLKKRYIVEKTETGEQIYIPLKPKNTE